MRYATACLAGILAFMQLNSKSVHLPWCYCCIETNYTAEHLKFQKSIGQMLGVDDFPRVL